MTPQPTKKQRITILQKSIESLSGIQGSKADFRSGLILANEVLNSYPPYMDSGKEQKADRLVVLARSKIGFGLIGDIPAKEALRLSLSYLRGSLGFLVD